MKTIVAFLVINQIPELPKAAIQSVLEHSDSDICVGYLNEQDIAGLDFSDRVSFQKLVALPNQVLNGKYRDFSENLFYQIVRLKWQLIETLLVSQYELVLYSDLDVIWLRNPIAPIQDALHSNSDVSLLIQSFTSDPSQPKLCMGFVAFRNCDVSRQIVAKCKNLHAEMILLSPQLGDDDVVTKYFVESGFNSQIQLLPQSTFPVGSLLNLYITKPRFPGLSSPEPYIFHLNYVVGLQNKRIMLRLLKRRFKLRIGIRGMPSWFLLLSLKRLRNNLWLIKRKLRSLF